MSKFDLSRIVGAAGVSESDTELREIPLEKIRENPGNFYPPLPEDEAEALRESIQANGLLEPLLVVADGDTYRLVSGHNRFRALRDLRANALGMAYKTALCRVLPAMDPDHEITVIIEANRQRKKKPALLQEEAKRLDRVVHTAKAGRRRSSGPNPGPGGGGHAGERHETGQPQRHQKRHPGACICIGMGKREHFRGLRPGNCSDGRRKPAPAGSCLAGR